MMNMFYWTFMLQSGDIRINAQNDPRAVISPFT